MSLQALSAFLEFQLLAFLAGKRLVFIKALPWKEDDNILGSKVTVQIIEDKTQYPKPDTTNFGEQLTIKVRRVTPDAYAKLKPLTTEVYVKEVEKAVVYGEYRNQLSIIGTVAVKEAPAAK
mgnify:CR=1 FL=1